jgi:hypothetical protein
MRKASSRFRERKGRRETMGRIMSVTKELATAVKEEAKLEDSMLVECS